MKFKKQTSLFLAAVLTVAGLSGCAEKKETANGEIEITISNWPDETNQKGVEAWDGYLNEFNEKFPNVKVNKDTTAFSDPKTFQVKAAANQLSTLYLSYFTEIQSVIKQGYAADITDVLKEKGYMDALNPTLMELCKGPDGKYYAYPTSAYLRTMSINKDLYTQAGLVNEDGTIKIPDTYEELAEYSKIVKEKTGTAGFAISTTNNCGGWDFINIAWSFGVEFMKQRDDGTWEATFNTQEMRDALQYVKDLRWKYDCLPDETVIDQATLHKLFAVGQAAVTFGGISQNYSSKYGMDPSIMVFAKMPEGRAGRYSQMGGGVAMFAPNSTNEQINACLDFYEITGIKPRVTEADAKKIADSAALTIESKGIVLPGKTLPLANDDESIRITKEAEAPYVNIPLENCESALDLSNVIIKPEEPACCQQLYAVLDGCIQEVLTNENADVAKLVETACNDFQVNHLDKQ